MPLALNIFNNEVQTVVPDYNTVNLALSSEVQDLSNSTFNSAVLSSKNYVQGNFLPLSGGTLTGLLSASQGLTVNNKTTFTGTITGNPELPDFSQPPVSFQRGIAIAGGAFNGPSFAILQGKALQGGSLAVNSGTVGGTGANSVALHNSTVLQGTANLALNAGYAYGFNSIASGLSYSGANYSVAFGDDCFASGNACFVAGRKATAGTPYFFTFGAPTGGGGVTLVFGGISGPPSSLQPLIKVVSLTSTFGGVLNPPLEAIVQDPVTTGTSPWTISAQLFRGSVPSGATGYIVVAGTFGLGNNAVAFGQSSSAFGEDSFVTGYFTQASGARSNAHGAFTKALNDQSFAFGNRTIALGLNTVVEGVSSQAIGDQSHAEGNGTIAKGLNSHSEGYETLAQGDQSHAEGFQSRALGLNSFAGGFRCVSSGNQSYSYGQECSATNIASFALGTFSNASQPAAFAIGTNAIAEHQNSIVLGCNISNTNSTKPFQFLVDAANGCTLGYNVGINTDPPIGTALTVNGAISGNAGITNTAFTGDTFITTSSNVSPQTATTYTIQLSDNGRLITLDNSSAISVNLPDGFPVGFSASFIQLGTGQVSFFPVGVALLYSDGSKFKIASQYSMATIVSHNQDEYVLAGNISL